jgi:iron complex outermembrane receptor protein
MRKFPVLAGLLAATATSQPLSAQPADVTADAPEQAKDAHPDPDQAIVITGTRRHTQDVLGSVSVLDSAQLNRDIKPSLGDTLASLPGVSASSFGPSASRPIVRGLAGDRVRVLTDGIGSLDLSSSDPDHAVAINPLTAEQIEVLHGPTALLYGSSAIGGVVNVIDRRIPRRFPADSVSGEADASYATAAKERSVSGTIDIPLGAKFVAHVDGAYSKYDDLHIGGYVLTKELRREAAASPDPGIRELADLKGKLPNTAGRTDDIAAGAAFVDGDTNIGISLSHHDAKYGVPVRYSLDPEIEPEVPTIDAHQNRVDGRANIALGGWFKALDLRGGLSRYHHAELEEDGEVGSRFFSNGGEVRADLVQVDRGGWTGTSGVDAFRQTARIRGAEKYLPDSVNRQQSFYTLQSLVHGPLRMEGAIRIERARLTAAEDEQVAEDGDADSIIGHVPLSRRFTDWSASLGGNVDISNGWRVGLALTRSARIPSIEELFANGAHGGSQAFLVGDPDLRPERSVGAELSVHKTSGPFHVEASVYASHYSNFIYQTPRGEIEDNLPVFDYRQGKANYSGFEVRADAKLGSALGIDWGSELTADGVRATVKGYGPAPLIPPLRILAGLTGARGPLDGRIEVERAFAHNRTGPLETPTHGYTLFNASLDWHPIPSKPGITLSIQGDNLFDVDARRSTSLLKDYAPLAGRDIRLSARLAF